jgi:hypothetical protein
LTGSFLDTTIVIHIADQGNPDKAKGEKFVESNQPAESPYYALRELLDGHIHYLCDTHNAILAADNIAEALQALLNRSPAEGRKKGAKLQAFATALKSAFTYNPTGSRGDDQKREMLAALALRINSIWRSAHRLKNVNLVQHLGCFNEGKIAYGAAGELRGPGDSFSCIKSQRCSAAAYLYDNKSDLTKMIEALHPKNLGAAVAAKNENAKRRKALKELLDKGPKDFDKGRCRALGDAYFAAMCPASSVVVTSNTVDYMPLCVALSKKAVET